MLDVTPAATVARLIQLSVAPVFLLAGVGSILNVVAARLARVVDRARSLESGFAAMSEAERERARWELARLRRRMRLTNNAITACTSSALFVCLVVATLFVSVLIQVDLSRLVAVLFITAMLLMILGLVLFLAEVRLTSRTMRAHTELLDAAAKAPEPPVAS